MGLNWNFLRGGGNQTKKPSVGGVRILSGTTHFRMALKWSIDLYIDSTYQLNRCFDMKG